MLPQDYGGGQASSQGSTNLGDILERVLDKGLVIAGDIRVNLLDIELLTIKLRLLIVSVETARELGIDWWERDSWLSSKQRDLEDENERLRERLTALDKSGGGHRAVEGPQNTPAGERPAREEPRKEHRA
jgi:hypothetical protein